MNYPNGCIIQTYNMSAASIVQLPCISDQVSPPDGFRAVVISGAIISDSNGGNFPNQVGPAFSGGSPGALLFDLTQLVQQNRLSVARSIAVQTSWAGSATGSPDGTVIRFDSGISVPCGPMGKGVNYVIGHYTVADFLSQNPIFSLQCGQATVNGGASEFVIAVTNFKLDPVNVEATADPLFQ